MRRCRIPAVLPVILLFCFTAAAAPVRITSGELFIGGTSYATPGYQTYIRYLMYGEVRNPKRTYRFDVEQAGTIPEGHPSQPMGPYEYRVRMPNHGSGIGINEARIFPVWYECEWVFRADVTTPEATATSPAFQTVSAPFSFGGSSIFSGALVTGFRVTGSGTVQLNLEKIGTKYYVREARYLFGTSASAAAGN